MKLSEVFEGLDITILKADPELEITGISYDSRTTEPGNLFVAVKGFESDGHRFIKAAVEKGAACILCEDELELEVPYARTDNSRRALAAVSANWFGHPSKTMTMVGVTGTNGKTTTTHLIKTLIEKCANGKVGLIGTNNIVIGETTYEAHHTTPESWELQKLLREMADAGCTHVVMEVSSHALYLDRVYNVRFQIGVFTNLTHEHLDFHKTMDDYAAAKALLFAQCDKAVINLDDDYAPVMVKAADGAGVPVLSFSTEKDEADVVGKRIRVFADKVDFCALTMDQLQKFELHIPARFSVYNALAAVTTGIGLGYGLEALSEALAACEGVKGRLEVVPTGRDFTVVIDYAHKPYALENLIATFKEIAQGRVVTLFGCGGDRDAAKRPMMGEIAARLSDFVIVTSDNPRTENPGKIIEDILVGLKGTKTPYTVIENRREAIEWALKNAQSDDILLLAGKGHETYQILGREKIHFDERDVIHDYFETDQKGQVEAGAK